MTLQREIRGKDDKLSRYKCGVCSAEFNSSFQRDRHLRAHSAADTTPPDVVICQLCSKTCDSQNYLAGHLPSHAVIYFCSVCSAFFPSSQRLVGHLNIHRSQPSSSPPFSSADLFWQSIAASVFLPGSTGSGVSWLSGVADAVCDEQLGTHPEEGLDDVLQDVDCPSVAVLTRRDFDVLRTITHSVLQCSQEVAQFTEQTRNVAAHSDPSSDSPSIDRNVCLKIGYKPLSHEMFTRLRRTFGSSECDRCGQLFAVQSDLDSHLSVHTGPSLLFRLILS